ncbi:hypothetical protein HPSA50_1693 [Helicobacter pylori SouthAfrica50]|uniref:Uncharacterized protein n=1 Tax=Helicobacter pylori SouthAfrica50 TaxID=1352357 RepID=T2S9R9_HELPX|nr:hypothetical protein HPSA50_1693 [Helicobacter pylori SouthAfrica50]
MVRTLRKIKTCKEHKMGSYYGSFIVVVKHYPTLIHKLQ